MKTKIIPFDLETAKKIQAGEINGKIKTRDGEREMRIVCYDSTAKFRCTIQPIITQSVEDCGELFAYFKNGAYEEEEHPEDLVLEVPDNEPQEPQFKPFDKVLIRDLDNEEWMAGIFSHMTNYKQRFACVGYLFTYQCIPYEGNEHLLGTTNKPKED